MKNMKYTNYLLGLVLLASCGVSKMTYKYPLNAENEKKIYDVANFSQSFGQLDTWYQTDSPYHLYLRSGFYNMNHFSLSLTASTGKSDDAFYVTMRASGGKKFVRNISKQRRKAFLNELKNTLSNTPQ